MGGGIYAVFSERKTPAIQIFCYTQNVVCTYPKDTETVKWSCMGSLQDGDARGTSDN